MTLSLRSRDTSRTFERLYRAHVGDVYRYALALTGNRSDAEDVTQTTFMQAYRALDRGEHPVKPRNWLITVAHNVCRQRFRETARRPVEVEYDEDVGEALVPSEDGPTATDIQRALGQLALNQREALVMRELEGRSYAEIAATMGLTVAAVETLIFRARRALREQLEGSLSCSEAEAALSLQLDQRLGRSDAGLLRGHLRACESCRRLARRQRAQRKAVKSLAAIPVPPGLAIPWLAGGSAASGTAVGAGIMVKLAALTVTAAAVGGGGYAIVQHEAVTHKPSAPALTAAKAASHHIRTTTAPVPGHSSGRRRGFAHRSTPRPFVARTAPVHPAHPSHPARGTVAKTNSKTSAHLHASAQRPTKKLVLPVHDTATSSKGHACRTRPTTTVTTPTITTSAPKCPIAGANGNSNAHPKQH